jgi:hypothetical protein
VDSISDLDAQECPHVERLREARTVLHELPALDGYPELEREIQQRFLTIEDPGQNLYQIKNARILGANYFHPLITNKDRFVLDQAAYELEQGRHPAHYALKLPRCQKVGGTTFSLASRWSDNYWHWLFDCIGKWLLFQKNPPAGVPQIENIAGLNLEQYAYKLQSLEALGIARNRLVDIQASSHFEFENLYLAGLPSQIPYPELDLIEVLRDAFLVKASGKNPSRRIYISRGKSGSRRVTNEPELEGLLSEFGFEKIYLEDLGFLEQVEVFKNAATIFSQHGAGLTNLVFATQGVQVFEMFEPGFVNPCYALLSKKVGADYKILFNGKSDDFRVVLSMVNAPYQVQVDCGVVAHALKKMK